MSVSELMDLNHMDEESTLAIDSTILVREWAHDGTLSAASDRDRAPSLLGKGAKDGMHGPRQANRDRVWWWWWWWNSTLEGDGCRNH